MPERGIYRGWYSAARQLSGEARRFACADPSLGVQTLIPFSVPERRLPQSGGWGIVFSTSHRSDLDVQGLQILPAPFGTIFPRRHRGD